MYITADCKFFDKATAAGESKHEIVNGNKGSMVIVEVSGGTGCEVAIQGRILPGVGEWHNVALVNMSTLEVAKTMTENGIYSGNVNGLCDITSVAICVILFRFCFSAISTSIMCSSSRNTSHDPFMFATILVRTRSFI